MSSNGQVERRAAALSLPELIYPDPSILPDLQRSYVACPLQRKLGVVDRRDKPEHYPRRRADTSELDAPQPCAVPADAD